jgi:Zn-dependent protease
MNFSWKLGRVAGIDLFLNPTFLLLLAWGAMESGLDGAMLIAAVFGCVVLHELGHALTARLFGIQTRDITLYCIGGVARLERMPRAPGAELLITLAGPLVNVGIASVLALALWVEGAFSPWFVGSYATGFAMNLMVINLILAAFNMIPAFPMDGGRILRALLSGPLGRYRATEIAAGTGRVLAVGLPLLMIALDRFSVMHLLLAAFIFYAGSAELAQVRSEGHSNGRDSDDDSDGVWTAPPGFRWVSRGNGVWQLAPISVHSNPWERRPWR